MNELKESLFFSFFFFYNKKTPVECFVMQYHFITKNVFGLFLIKSPHNGDGILPHFTFTLHVHDSAHHQYSHKQKVTFILAPFLIKNVDDKLPKQHYKSNSDKCTQGAHSI